MEVIVVRRATVLLFVQLERTNPYRKAKDRELTDRLVSRFGFLKFPKTYEDYNDVDNGIAFAEGVYEGIEVPELKLFPNGFLISTGESTDVAERMFANEIVNIWQQAGLNLSEDSVDSRSYISQLVVRSTIDLLHLSNPLNAVLENWFPWKPVGIGMLGIFTKGDTETAPPVRIERLGGAPIEKLEFWAQAPLQTALHLAFLTKWETVVKESLSSSIVPGRPPSQSPSAASG